MNHVNRRWTCALAAVFLCTSTLANELFLEDQNGCKVYDPRPQRGETVTWSGQCVNGYAEGPGTLVWFNELRHAKQRVDGILVQGKHEGKVVTIDEDGNRVEAIAHADVQESHVFVTYKDGKTADITRSLTGGRDHYVFVYPSGDRYEGEGSDGRRWGEGTYTWLNGDRYEGNYVNTKRTGHGVLIWMNGVRYEGNFSDGAITGEGVQTFSDGSRYEGGFRDFGFYGHGVYISADGSRFEGFFTDGADSPQDRPPIIGKPNHGTVTLSREFKDWARAVSKQTWAEYWSKNGPSRDLMSDSGFLEAETDAQGKVGTWKLVQSSGWSDLDSGYEAAANRVTAAPSPLKSQTLRMFFMYRPSQPQGYQVSDDRPGFLYDRAAAQSALPPNLKYADLTPQQKSLVKSDYEAMAETDEPPFPLNGLSELLRSLSKVNENIGATGRLRMAVTVDETGNATAVKVIESPGPQSTKAVATLLMLQKYKPAICKGAPCTMDYYFVTNFLPAR